MIEKVFLSDDNKAVFVCPKCKKARSVDVSQYSNLAKASKIKCKCSCGHTYTVNLETRSHYRKKTSLAGIYTHIVSSIGEKFCEEIERGIITITDISQSGLQLKLNKKPNFEVDSKLMLEFRLKDNKKTLIKKEVIIRNLKDLSVGAKFCTVSSKDPYDKAIRLYLTDS